MIAKMLNPTTKLEIPIGTQTNEANAGTEMQPAIVEARISKCST